MSDLRIVSGLLFSGHTHNFCNIGPWSAIIYGLNT